MNTFREKYGGLPGDLNGVSATQFGFAPRGQYAGEGDGNGIIEGISADASAHNYGNCEDAGETLMFWQDLSAAHLIDGNFTSASFTAVAANVTAATSPSIDAYLPAAKLGGGNYFYVWSGGIFYGGQLIGTNLLGISAVTAISSGNCGVTSTPGITVKQAYDIDKKIDDGMPQTGNVTATYLTGTYWPIWAAGGGGRGYQRERLCGLLRQRQCQVLRRPATTMEEARDISNIPWK